MSEDMEKCRVCRNWYKRDRIVQHLKQKHGKTECTRATIDQFNVSDSSMSSDGDEVILPAADARDVQALMRKLTVDLKVAPPLPKVTPPKKPKAPPRLAEEIVAHADFEGPLTLDDYLQDKNANNTLGYHVTFLTSCIATVTNTAMYIVKQRIDGRLTHNLFAKVALTKLLDTKACTMAYMGKTKDFTYGRLLDIPLISNNLKRFTATDFAGTDPKRFNMWRGYAFEPLDDDEEVDLELIGPFLEHVKNVICGGDLKNFSVEITKDAWMFQHPNDHVQWATVLMGEEGAGKGIYTDLLCDLWGNAWTERNINNIDQITGDNNRDLIGFKKLIVPNELQSLENGRKNFDIMKSRITDRFYVLRNLYESPQTMRNVNNYIFSTNNYDSIKMGLRDRRYFVLEVSDEHVGQIEEYFDPLVASFTDEMKRQLLSYFLRYDATNFNPFVPPETALKATIKEMNISLPEQWMAQFEWQDAKKGLTLDGLWMRFTNWCDAMSLDRKFMGKSGVSFGMKLRGMVRKETKKVGGKATVLYFPLETAPAEAEDDEDVLVVTFPKEEDSE
jgi:hypothetical protein